MNIRRRVVDVCNTRSKIFFRLYYTCWMIETIDNIKNTRLFLLKLLEGLSPEQLNKVPPGFNNNIIWNLAHLIAAQQGLCYIRSGNTPPVDPAYILPFKPDTQPERYIAEEEVQVIKSLLISSVDQLKVDYQKDIFNNYTTFTTRYGAVLSNIVDAINFLGYHEGLHSGYIMALKRLVV